MPMFTPEGGLGGAGAEASPRGLHAPSVYSCTTFLVHVKSHTHTASCDGRLTHLWLRAVDFSREPRRLSVRAAPACWAGVLGPVPRSSRQ